MPESTVKIILQALGGKQVQGELGRIQERFKSLRGAVFNLRTALAGVGAGLVAKSFLDAADSAEGYRTRLSRLLGSVKEGNRLFAKMAAFASRVPFEYEKIMGAATQLAGVMKGGVDEVARWMPLIGDLAAVTGISLEETTGQVIRMYSAGAASADMFRERGVLAMMGFKAGVSYTAEETRRIMFDNWKKAGSQFRGATGDLADDWSGLTSMMADKWFKYRNDVMNAAPFDYLKSSLDLLNRRLDETAGDTEDSARRIGEGIVNLFENTALGVAGIADAVTPAVKKIYSIVRDVWKSFQGLPPWAKEMGVIGALLGGKKGALVVGGLSLLTEKIKTSAQGLALAVEGQFTEGGLWENLAAWAKSNPEEMEKVVTEWNAGFEQALKKKGLKIGDLLPGLAGDEGGTLTERLRALLAGIRENMKKFGDDTDDSKSSVDGLNDGLSVTKETVDRINKSHGAMTKTAQKLFDSTRTSAEEYKAVLDELDDLVANGYISWDTYRRAAKAALEEIDGAGESLADTLKNAVTGWASTFGSTLNDLVWDADVSFKKILESFGRMITRMIIQKQVVEPLMASILPSAHGNAFEGGRVLAFARGGVVTRPTIFPMADGAGLMGEAGPEAVLPLKRTSGGDLGVSAEGMGAVTNVYVYNNAPGAEASVTERDNDRGGKDIEVWIKEVSAQGMVRGPGADVLKNVYKLGPRTAGR